MATAALVGVALAISVVLFLVALSGYDERRDRVIAEREAWVRDLAQECIRSGDMEPCINISGRPG